MASGNDIFQKLGSMKLPIWNMHLWSLNRDKFDIWKQRILIIMDACDPRLRFIVEEGPNIPTIVSATDPTRQVPKKLTEKTREEITLVSLDKIAKYIISSALDDSNFDRIMYCKSAKEMWDTLERFMNIDW